MMDIIGTFEAIMLLIIALGALAIAVLVEPKAFSSNNLSRQEQIESDRFDEDKL